MNTPEYASVAAIEIAAHRFVETLGIQNRKFMIENLRYVQHSSDGLAALMRALYAQPHQPRREN